VVVLSPLTGRLVATHGPRRPLLVAGAALALGGGGSLWLGPSTPLPYVLAIYVLFGIFLASVNPPITNTAVSGMPGSMVGVAASVASVGRQTGTTLGVAISGTVAAGPTVWWLVSGLGVGIVTLALLSTGRHARMTATRAASLFEAVDTGRLARPDRAVERSYDTERR
jgi:MFS family permease